MVGLDRRQYVGGLHCSCMPDEDDGGLHSREYSQRQLDGHAAAAAAANKTGCETDRMSCTPRLI